MDRTPLYAQFDGDEILGTVYPLGEEISQDVDAGTRSVLVEMGRLSATKPPVPFVMPTAVDKNVGDMSRAELEQSALAIASASLADRSEDDLREFVSRGRDEADQRAKDADEERQRAIDASKTNEAGSTPYADLKDKPLNTLKTAELVTIADEENISLVDARTNPDRVKLIEDARKAKASSDTPAA